MGQVDVQNILNAIQNYNASQVQQQQLSMQGQQFKDRLAQELQIANMEHDTQMKDLALRKSHFNLAAAQLGRDADTVSAQSMGFTPMGGMSGLTTGDKNETQMMLMQNPNIIDPTTNQPMQIIVPTPLARANQLAQQKTILQAPDLAAKKQEMGWDLQNRLAELASSQSAARTLEDIRQKGEMERLGKELGGRMDIAQMEDNTRRYVANTEDNTRRYLGNLQYGPIGPGGDPRANAITGAINLVRDGQASLSDVLKDFPMKNEKDAIAGGVMSSGIQSLNPKQIDSFKKIGDIQNIVNQMDGLMQINRFTSPQQWDTKKKEIDAKLGQVAEVLGAEPGRKSQWILQQAKGGYSPQYTSLPANNMNKRDQLVKDTREHFKSLLQGFSDEQKNHILHTYGLDQLQTSDEAKGNKAGTSNNVNWKYDSSGKLVPATQ